MGCSYSVSLTANSVGGGVLTHTLHNANPQLAV